MSSPECGFESCDQPAKNAVQVFCFVQKGKPLDYVGAGYACAQCSKKPGVLVMGAIDEIDPCEHCGRDLDYTARRIAARGITKSITCRGCGKQRRCGKKEAQP